MITTMEFTDGYKLDHRRQYPNGTEFVYSNWTPRSNAYFPEAEDGCVVFGIQYFIKEYLIKRFNEDFFNLDEDCQIEIDDFVIHADDVNAINDDRKFIIEHMSNTDVDAIVEWCPECCDEVALLNKFDAQICPSCGRPIVPCCLCDDCLGWDSGCPLRYKYNMLLKNVQQK